MDGPQTTWFTNGKVLNRSNLQEIFPYQEASKWTVMTTKTVTSKLQQVKPWNYFFCTQFSDSTPWSEIENSIQKYGKRYNNICSYIKFTQNHQKMAKNLYKPLNCRKVASRSVSISSTPIKVKKWIVVLLCTNPWLLQWLY